MFCGGGVSCLVSVVRASEICVVMIDLYVFYPGDRKSAGFVTEGHSTKYLRVFVILLNSPT